MDTATSTHCRNCGAATSGNYCHMCGQETRLHPPSFGEFMHEFIGHYVALEGRLWGSITRLLFRPGLLTNEYLAGRRKRYVEPLRLYLSLSIIFFAVLKLSGADIVNADEHSARPRGAQVQAPAQAEQQPGKIMDENLERWLQRKAPSVYQAGERFDKMTLRQRGEVIQAGFYKFTPYALFLLMPLFALYLKVLYLGTGRRYGEHLLFALHANAFAYIVLGVFLFLPDGFLKFLAFCWMIGYLPWAMQRVYHKGKWGTAWRWLLLIVLHGLSLSVAILAAIAAGVLTAH